MLNDLRALFFVPRSYRGGGGGRLYALWKGADTFSSLLLNTHTTGGVEQLSYDYRGLNPVEGGLRKLCNTGTTATSMVVDDADFTITNLVGSDSDHRPKEGFLEHFTKHVLVLYLEGDVVDWKNLSITDEINKHIATRR